MRISRFSVPGPNYASILGLSALGQTCYTDDSGNEICDSGVPPTEPSSGCTLTSPPSPGYTCVEDACGNCVGPQTATAAPSTAPSATAPSTTAANPLTSILQGAAATSQLIKSTQNPTLVSGTSLVYNPATGQLVNAAGLPISSTAYGYTGVTSLGSMLPLLLIGGGLLVVVLAMGGHK